VHLFGQLADVPPICSFCAERGLLLIEDAAQAHGARIEARGAGSFGEAGAFSFYPSKNLGGLGDAGCVVTDDPVLAQLVRALRNYGGTKKYEHEYRGLNSRMSELQAAVLTIKLGHLDADNMRRRDIARRYRAGLANSLVVPPMEPDDAARHVWHLYVIRTAHRANLAAHLNSRSIETLVHYPRTINEQPAYARAIDSLAVPVASRMQHEVLSLPISPVMSDAEVDYVVDAVNSWRVQ
jgi:dTDP-4-amino-4,6-dideoxygalactose transaminase